MVWRSFNSFWCVLSVARFKICVGVFPVCLLSHARLRCMCTCNRCTFCLCQNFLNSELLQMVRAKLYTVVLRRSLISYNHLHLWLHVIIIPSLSHPFLFYSVFLSRCFMVSDVSSTFLFCTRFESMSYVNHSVTH